MKTKLNGFLLALLMTTSFSSCFLDDDDGLFNCERGEGEIITRTLDVPDFTGIDLDCSFDVTIAQGDEQIVKVEGHENIIDLLELDVQNNIWDIEFDRCIRGDDDELKIHITVPKLTFIKISGSGKVFGENDIQADEIELKISGSGNMDLALFANDISGKISGSGQITLEGETQTFNYETSGSGDWRTFEMLSREGNVRITGSGDTEVNVSEKLDVRISGSGDVFYKGNPLIDIDITGSGSLVNSN